MANEQILRRLKWPDPELQTGDEFVRVSDLAALFAPAAALLPGPVPMPTPLPPIADPAPAPASRIVTHVTVQSTSDADQENVPITFGQVFAPGHVLVGAGLVGMLSTGGQVVLQVDEKATHPDGSVRHAAISAILPRLPAGGEVVLGLAVVAGARSAFDVWQGPFFDTSLIGPIEIVVDGRKYATAKGRGMQGADRKEWLAGHIVRESMTSVPFVDEDGAPHPHLHARLSARTYAGGRSRVEVVLENAWAYEPEPRNFTYDARVLVDGEVVAEYAALEHYHHARWRRTFWTGGAEPAVHIQHNPHYLVDTRAVPNYDAFVKVKESTLAGYLKKWDAATVGPMKIGPLVNPYMPTTGGRNDLGLLPGWAAAYLISQDERAKRVTLGTAEMAGSWSVHYRDKDTDLPVSLIDYPYMTLLGNAGDTKNPVTKKQEAFPKLVKATSTTPYTADSSHQPAFSYLPYLVTAEFYHLEELQFWAMWNVFQTNPGYRGNVLGLLYRTQVRGQAWSLRTLAEAAYITPDAHPLKNHFARILDSNLDWYNATFSDSPDANALGVLDTPGAVIYNSNTAVAPWQDDFFTSAVGHVLDLGFTKAGPLLVWKSKFPIGRMLGEGVDWQAAANYTYTVRTTPTSPVFGSIGEAYRATTVQDLKPGSIGNYPTEATGYAANMQPALAYAAETGPDGQRAWALFTARKVKPDYGASPQFAIVPRV